MNSHKLQKDIQQCDNLALHMDLKLHENTVENQRGDETEQRLETAIEKEDEDSNGSSRSDSINEVYPKAK